MTRKCHNHRLQTNSRHLEKETQNTDRHKTTSFLFAKKMIAKLVRAPRTIKQNKGPGSLTRIFVTRRGCLAQNINPVSPTPKSILGITQIITKAYQVTKFNQNILIYTISISELFTLPKRSGVCIRSIILLALCSKPLSLLFYPSLPLVLYAL